MVDVLGLTGVHRQCLKNGFQIADAHALAKQVLQDALQLAGTKQPGYNLAGQGRRRGTNPVKQPLNLFAGQELVSVIGDDFPEVVGDDGRDSWTRQPASSATSRPSA